MGILTYLSLLQPHLTFQSVKEIILKIAFFYVIKNTPILFYFNTVVKKNNNKEREKKKKNPNF